MSCGYSQLTEKKLLTDRGDEYLIISFMSSSLFLLTSINLHCFVSSALATVHLVDKYQKYQKCHAFQIN